MLKKQDVIEWLQWLPEGAEVGVDDGGLCLVVYPCRDAGDDDGPYLEIGGIPEEVENAD